MSVALSCDRCKPCLCVYVCSLKVRQVSLPACDCHVTNINLACVRERLCEWVSFMCHNVFVRGRERVGVLCVCSWVCMSQCMCAFYTCVVPDWGHTDLLTVCPSPSVQILTPRWTTCTAPRVCSRRHSPAMPRPLMSTRSRPSSSSLASSWLRPWWTPGWSVRCWLC